METLPCKIDPCANWPDRVFQTVLNTSYASTNDATEQNFAICMVPRTRPPIWMPQMPPVEGYRIRLSNKSGWLGDCLAELIKLNY